MYELAATLDPERYLALATATFAEMALAGYSCVGEFHYLHHGVGGHPYDEPNVMGEVLRLAAADAGIRLTLLDTCYLHGGFGIAPDDVQRRFSDGDADSWAARVERVGVVGRRPDRCRDPFGASRRSACRWRWSARGPPAVARRSTPT